MYEDLTLEGQRKAIEKWTMPNVIPTTVTFPYIPPLGGIHNLSSLLATKLYLARRQKGTGMGNFQCHHGGVMDPKDTSAPEAAVRELREETGFDVGAEELSVVGIFGPEHYRALVGSDEDGVTMTTIDQPANPKHPFLFHVFAADVTGQTPSATTDDEIKAYGWISVFDLISEHGESLQFNYWTLLAMFGESFINPGIYYFRFPLVENARIWQKLK